MVDVFRSLPNYSQVRAIEIELHYIPFINNRVHRWAVAAALPRAFSPSAPILIEDNYVVQEGGPEDGTPLLPY